MKQTINNIVAAATLTILANNANAEGTEPNQKTEPQNPTSQTSLAQVVIPPQIAFKTKTNEECIEASLNTHAQLSLQIGQSNHFEKSQPISVTSAYGCALPNKIITTICESFLEAGKGQALTTCSTLEPEAPKIEPKEREFYTAINSPRTYTF